MVVASEVIVDVGRGAGCVERLARQDVISELGKRRKKKKQTKEEKRCLGTGPHAGEGRQRQNSTNSHAYSQIDSCLLDGDGASRAIQFNDVAGACDCVGVTSLSDPSGRRVDSLVFHFAFRGRYLSHGVGISLVDGTSGVVGQIYGKEFARIHKVVQDELQRTTADAEAGRCRGEIK